ncbi:MAG: peptide-methionine (S)-S-oxide reductase MsrA [Crocinitomicaceae bacterium]|nr:peptide-methionine (S)-S-oxide reductase MsrA [Crocinitomicaceae bacterium]
MIKLVMFLLLFTSFANAQTGKTQTAYFASGCFWCTEAIFELIVGVKSAESGYTGGKTVKPTYEQVCSGKTGHAEAIKVVYYPASVSYEKLVRAFFESHDPSTLNQQGPDKGTQYRSAIFYQNDMEKQQALSYIKVLKEKKTFKAITTEVVPFTVFYPAEYYHQDYEKKNPNNGYIQGVSKPRMAAFKKKTKLLLHE